MARDLLNACIEAAECESNVMEFLSVPQAGAGLLSFAATTG
jgi:hypothetical protein